MLFLTSTKLCLSSDLRIILLFLIYHALSLYECMFWQQGNFNREKATKLSVGLCCCSLLATMSSYAQKTLPPRKKKPVSKKKLKITAPGEWTRCPPKWSREGEAQWLFTSLFLSHDLSLLTSKFCCPVCIRDSSEKQGWLRIRRWFLPLTTCTKSIEYWFYLTNSFLIGWEYAVRHVEFEDIFSPPEFWTAP